MVWLGLGVARRGVNGQLKSSDGEDLMSCKSCKRGQQMMKIKKDEVIVKMCIWVRRSAGWPVRPPVRFLFRYSSERD